MGGALLSIGSASGAASGKALGYGPEAREVNNFYFKTGLKHSTPSLCPVLVTTKAYPYKTAPMHSHFSNAGSNKYNTNTNLTKIRS
jgi:hypothetical protein